MSDPLMDWPTVATSDSPLPETLTLEARDGDVATYQTCTNPDCPAIKPDTEHAHLISVERNEGATFYTNEAFLASLTSSNRKEQ